MREVLAVSHKYNSVKQTTSGQVTVNDVKADINNGRLAMGV